MYGVQTRLSRVDEIMLVGRTEFRGNFDLISKGIIDTISVALKNVADMQKKKQKANDCVLDNTARSGF